MRSFLVFFFFLLLDRLAEFVAVSRRSAPDARAWKEVVLGTHCWLLGGLFASMGWMLMTNGFLLADSTLGQAVVVLGGAVALLSAFFFLYGASTFMTAKELFREARRRKDEIPL